MITEAELIVDRRKLKRKLTLWRVLAVAVALAAMIALSWQAGLFGNLRDHVARIRIDGLITGDQATLNLLDEIARAERVKAVIVRIDSPGGTTAGSEAIYGALRLIAKDKPVVAVMDTVAASGGYITAISADHIVARGSTITGSIGVIFSFPEISRLLDTLGIRMEEIKSGDLKAEPSPYRPVSDKARAVSQEMVMEGYEWFVGLVAERRKIPLTEVKRLADGRVYTGRQAVANKLIDELGGEDVARAWLTAEKDISAGLETIDWAPRPAAGSTGLGFSLNGLVLRLFGLEALEDGIQRAKLDGLLALWHPDL